jgi:antibiotic biosynthesis monooxygenase (ABM) superfamily enzyme
VNPCRFGRVFRGFLVTDLAEWGPIVEMRWPGASAVIVQRVRPADADWFMDWQRGITAVAEGFAGYRATDVYPPANGQQQEWVIVIHFDSDVALQQWLSSPARAEWVGKLRARSPDFELRAMPGGLGAWFAGLSRDPDAAPPAWKMVATVVLGLFPIVMLLQVFTAPYTPRLGFALSMLVGNIISVAILQWAVMPVLTRLLGPWLKANSQEQRAFTAGGLVGILLVLAGLVLLFRWLGIGEP